MEKLDTIFVTALLAVQCQALPWWDDFPRMVSDSTASAVGTVTNYHGNLGMNANGQDPGWGTFFQADGIRKNAAKIASFQNAGIKQIGYFETYGQSYCFVAELGAWDETNLTPVLHTHWNWQNYAGGTIRWLGAKNFFDDEDFARPYTRTHPRYGGPAMTYPDGTVASGYDGPDTDPRNSRVYDAGCSKDILGNLSIDDYKYPAGPTNGLVYIPSDNDYAGLMMFKKDSACPLWTDYTYASTLQAADAGIDGMWSDNYGPWDSLGYTVVQRGFGDWSVARFHDYLTNSFSTVELIGLGVTNAATFDIRDYLKGVALGWGWNGTSLTSAVWSRADWLDDPLWRAYLVFKRQVGTEALSNYYAAVKSAALAGGKTEFLVAGNDIPGFSLGWCRGDLDMVSTELALGYKNSSGSAGFTAPPTGRYAPLYKLAREHAQGRFVNIWLYNTSYETALSHPELCNVLYYEMLATHAMPKFDPASTKIAGDEATNAGFFDFVSQVAPVYGERVPVEDVGIYYSSSSVLRQLVPMGFAAFNAQPHQFGFWGWATALGELHYQYRAVPEWKLTPELLSTLRLLVIPNADVLDPADVAVLSPWVDGGGRLVITGDSGKYLGESGHFDVNTNGWSVASLTNHANVVYLPDNIGMDYYLAYTNRPPLLPQFSAAMDSALAGAGSAGIVDTTASGRAGITLYSDATAGRFFIDVDNFDIDLNTYAVNGTGLVEIEALCPAGLRGQRLKLSVMTPQANAPGITLVAASNDTIRIELGSVEYYAGVVIEKEAEWAGWQAVHFTPEEIAAGLANTGVDPDGDGFGNEQEFIAGSDPRDGASVFDVRISPSTGNTGVELAFGSATGRYYTLYYSTDLVNGKWAMLGTNMPGSGLPMAVDDTNQWSHAYYRVEATRP